MVIFKDSKTAIDALNDALTGITSRFDTMQSVIVFCLTQAIEHTQFTPMTNALNLVAKNPTLSLADKAKFRAYFRAHLENVTIKGTNNFDYEVKKKGKGPVIGTIPTATDRFWYQSETTAQKIINLDADKLIDNLLAKIDRASKETEKYKLTVSKDARAKLAALRA